MIKKDIFKHFVFLFCLLRWMQLKKPMADALKEVEEFYLLLMSLVVLRVNDVETAGQLAGSFCSEFRSSTEFPEFRLRLYV